MKRPDTLLAPGRQAKLVGLLTKDPGIVLEEGAQIVAEPNQSVPMTHDRPCHLVLLVGELRSVDLPWAWLPAAGR